MKKYNIEKIHKKRKYIYNYDINGCYETALHNTEKLYYLDFKSVIVEHHT